MQFTHKCIDQRLLFGYNSDIPKRKEALTMKNTLAVTAPVKKEKGRFLKGLDILTYALTAFLALGLEGVLAFVIEQNLYRCNIKEFNTWQSILHWVLTYIIWGAFAFYICRSTKKKGYELFPKTDKIRPWQWICIAVGVTVCLISTWIDWNGSKVLTELEHKGLLLFIFQYIYYFVEVFLVMLIIVCGQKACEVWFGQGEYSLRRHYRSSHMGLGTLVEQGFINSRIVHSILRTCSRQRLPAHQQKGKAHIRSALHNIHFIKEKE
jgi:hypothetical protein